MAGSDEKVYTTHTAAGRFEVRSQTGRVVMVCGDRDSADQYMLMLNEAYRAGFKAGYREGRNR